MHANMQKRTIKTPLFCNFKTPVKDDLRYFVFVVLPLVKKCNIFNYKNKLLGTKIGAKARIEPANLSNKNSGTHNQTMRVFS